MAEQKKNWSAAMPITIGSLAILLMVGALGAWSVGTQIAGAVVASGVIEVVEVSDADAVERPPEPEQVQEV